MLSALLIAGWALLAQVEAQAADKAPAEAAAPAEQEKPAAGAKAEAAPEAKAPPVPAAKSPIDPDAVKKLIRQLNALEKTRRDDAEKQLLEMGPAVLDLLPEANDRMPAEVIQRLDRVRGALQKSQAENAVLASTVTLASDDLKLSAVLEAIEKQTGNKLVDLREEFGQEAPDPTLKLDLTNVPFWEALDEVLDQASLNVYAFGSEQGGLGLVARSDSRVPRRGHAAYAGSFRIEGTEFTARRDLRDPQSHTMQLQIDVSWEPRLQPIVITQPTDGIEATDEQGHPVALSMMGNELEFPIDADAKLLEMPINFELPERSVRKIALLKGRLTAMLPGRSETFRFTGLEGAKNVERRKAGVTVVLDEVRKNNEVWEVRVRVVFDKASGALETHRGWIYNNPAYLETPKKEVLNVATMETTSETENEVGIAYLFDVPGGLKGHTFVYKTATAIVSVPIQYELKDLELP